MEVIFLIDYNEEQKKCGTVTVSVYTDDSNNHFFDIKSDTDDVLPVSYVIEDTLSLY
jgi:hypothetical protein